MRLNNHRARILGYRGLIFRQKGNKSKSKNLPNIFRLVNGDLFGPKLAHRVTDEKYEDFFCRTKGPIRRINLGRNFPSLRLGKRLYDLPNCVKNTK